MTKYPSVIGLMIGIGLATGVAQPPSTRPDKVHNPNVTEMLHFVVTSSGFGLSTVKVPAGKYVISVANRTGRPDLPLVLERVPPSAQGQAAQAAQTVRDSKTDNHTNRLLEKINLANGTYRIRVTSNPTWILTIEVI